MTTNKVPRRVCILIFLKFLMLLEYLEFKETSCLPKKYFVAYPAGVGAQIAQNTTKRACIFRVLNFFYAAFPLGTLKNHPAIVNNGFAEFSRGVRGEGGGGLRPIKYQ